MSSVKPVVQSALARTLSFLPTAVATLLTSRLIISHFGLGAFNSFALIVSLIALIPLNDLGVGAAVTSAFAQYGPRARSSERIALTSARVLAVSTIGVIVVATLLAIANLWPTLLGDASGSNTFVALAMAVFALSFLPGLGQRMLLGVDRNHVTVVVQSFFTPLILVATLVVMLAGLSGSWLMIVPPAALLVINIVTVVMSVRITGFPWRQVLRRLPSPHRYPGRSIRAISGPMLLITLSVPIALQSDRIVLSHVASRQAVANYSVVVQIFAPVAALIAASAQPLWPIYAKARSEGRPGPGLGRVLVLFCGAAALMCAFLVVISDPVGNLIGGGRIELGWLLPVAAGLAVLTQAAAYPVAMKLMDPAGVRFVALCTAVALPLNVGLSIWLGSWMGAPGPLLATFAVGVLVQTLPALVFSRRHESVGRHRYGSVRAPVPVIELAVSLLNAVPPLVLLDELLE
jgi:O-antigen/teichoic acid export membrane protein